MNILLGKEFDKFSVFYVRILSLASYTVHCPESDTANLTHPISQLENYLFIGNI